MPDREPVETKNLDTYGHAPLEGSPAHALLAPRTAGRATRSFLGTVRADGRPHAAGIGAVFHDGDVYVVSGPGTQRSRNLKPTRRARSRSASSPSTWSSKARRGGSPIRRRSSGSRRSTARAAGRP